MAGPVRIQRKRTKGWKMPPNTVSVTRPGKWGNPFYLINEEGFPWISDARDKSMPCCNHEAFLLVGSSASGENLTWTDARKGVVALFRQQCCDRSFAELRGKNIACWCPTDEPCHGDVILELANAGSAP
jgi:hypothetical protein